MFRCGNIEVFTQLFLRRTLESKYTTAPRTVNKAANLKSRSIKKYAPRNMKTIQIFLTSENLVCIAAMHA